MFNFRELSKNFQLITIHSVETLYYEYNRITFL